MLSWNEMTTKIRWQTEAKQNADLRQWENPKTWPILHQGIAGPIQSGRHPPSSSQLPTSAAGTSRSVDSLSSSSSSSSVSWWSAEQLPPSAASVTQQPRPASLHHRQRLRLHHCACSGRSVRYGTERETPTSAVIIHSQPICAHLSLIAWSHHRKRRCVVNNVKHKQVQNVQKKIWFQLWNVLLWNEPS